MLNKEQLEKECQFTATRSSGPGGQHVNKVSSRIELRFNVEESEVLNEAQKQIILSKLQTRINAEGCLILTCQESRSQPRNKELVLVKFFELLEEALKRRKKRIATKASKASRQKRLDSKKKDARKKEMRRKPDF